MTITTKYFAVLGALCPASVSLIAILTATPILAAPGADDSPAGASAASTDTHAVGAAVKRDARAVAKAGSDGQGPSLAAVLGSKPIRPLAPAECAERMSPNAKARSLAIFCSSSQVPRSSPPE